MRKFIVNNQIQLGQLATACEMIKEGNQLLSQGKKKSEAGKQAILHWLETEREVKTESLEIGEIIVVQGEKGDLLKLEIKGKSRLDQGEFQLKAPEVFQTFYKVFPEKSFSILMDTETLSTLKGKIEKQLERAKELNETLVKIASR